MSTKPTTWHYDAPTGTWQNPEMTGYLMEAVWTAPVEGGLTTPLDMGPINFSHSFLRELSEFNLENETQRKLVAQMRNLVAKGIPIAEPQLRAQVGNYGQDKMVVWYDNGLPEHHMHPRAADNPEKTLEEIASE